MHRYTKGMNTYEVSSPASRIPSLEKDEYIQRVQFCFPDSELGKGEGEGESTTSFYFVDTLTVSHLREGGQKEGSACPRMKSSGLHKTSNTSHLPRLGNLFVSFLFFPSLSAQLSPLSPLHSRTLFPPPAQTSAASHFHIIRVRHPQ
ncbi:hypothetical protein ACMFMF_005539 [Clarireedia jacksonii]